MNKRQFLSSNWPIRLAFLALLIFTVWQYSSSINFGFWWDDPVWYSHMLARQWWELLLPIPEFQYYRPGSMLYVSFFLQDNGTYNVIVLHWMQIGWHLLQVALSYAIVRLLKIRPWPAFFVALLVALYPFSYQATAWAAPNQPMAAAFQGGAWLFFLLAYQQQRRWYYLASLLLFFLAMTLQESSVALAFVPFLLQMVQKLRSLSFSQSLEAARGWLRHPVREGWHWPLFYPLVALLFVFVWFQVPRQAGITGWILDGKTAVYLLQGVVYPVLARLNGYPANQEMISLVVVAVVVSIALLLWLAAKQRRLALASVGFGWVLMSLLPAIVGLRFSYVSLASRLLHPAAPGIALLWVIGLWGGNGRSWLAWLGRLLLLGIALQSSLLLRQFEQLYAVGTHHLQEAITTMAEADGRLLFINFPDRYAPKQAPFPVGYWGMTLAPIVVDLADFTPLLTGETAVSGSRSMRWADQMKHEAVYDVDLRGVIIQPQELVSLAANYDAVYLSRYEADGSFHLQEAGRLLELRSEACLATFENGVCLQDVTLTPDADELLVQLTWSTATTLPPDLTVFVHLGLAGVPPLAQADGDSWLGLLPLADWPLDTAVVDPRTLPLPSGDQTLLVHIGLYNRFSGERLPGVDAARRPLPDNAFTISP